MNNQESMFSQQQQAYSPQPINTDPREQRQWQVPPSQEEYGEYQQRAGKIHSSQPRRRGPIISLVVLLLLLALAGSGIAYAFNSPSKPSGTPKMHTFHVTARPTLIMNIGSGSIHIHAGDSASVVVNETETVKGFNTSSVKVNYSQDGNTITISEQDNGFSIGFRDTNFDVTVPTASDLQLQSGSGSASISDVNGQIQTETGSGSISVNNISGQQATLKTDSGSITANNMNDQQATLHSGSGSITAQGLQGTAVLDTGSGDVTVKGGALRGNSQLKSGSSDIDYEGSLDPGGSYRFETGSGNVNLTLPASSAFNLNTNSDPGDVNNAFGNTSVGNGPRAQLSISTGSGSVTINKGN